MATIRIGFISVLFFRAKHLPQGRLIVIPTRGVFMLSISQLSKHTRAACVVVSTLLALFALQVSAGTSATPSEAKVSLPYKAVTYHGSAANEHGVPLSGTRALRLRYLDMQEQELVTETFENVELDAKGAFQVELGAGDVAQGTHFGSIGSLFAAHPELQFEVSIDGVAQAPFIGVLPAGHSLKTRLLAVGNDGSDNDAHWKHYTKANSTTSLQTGHLVPKKGDVEKVSYEHLRRRPFELPMTGPGVSVPVRDMARAVQQPIPKDSEEVNSLRHESLFDKQGNRYGTTGSKEFDRLAGAQSRSATRTPSLDFEFAGVGNVSGVLPPDTEATVGLNHYVHVVNSAFAIYDKSGNQLTGPVNTNTLWSGFGGPCQTDNSGDAIFAYDEQANRYVLTQFAVAGGNQSVCFAISQTGDPTGSYNLYEVVTPRFPDYYKLSVWPDPDNNAYFFGTNSGAQGQYDVFAVDRANMLAGATARPMQFFQNFVNLLIPADLDGPTGPPLGSPGIFYTFRDGGESYFNNPPADSIDVWEFNVDWTTPANTTFTLVNSLSPTPFNWTVCGFFVSNCLPQPGTSQGIDSASWWPMQRLVYRNFGSHQTLIGSWTVDVLASGNRAAPRWFELRDNGGGWSIFQEGTYSPDSVNRWMSSVAMDGSGNIAMGFSRGSGSDFASIYYASRNASDPLGTMGSEELLFAGTGAQTSTSSRWGDYSSMELDPADDCTFWFTSEYLASTSNANWLTRVGVFKVPGCGGPSFSVSCTPDAFTLDQGGSDTAICTVSSQGGFNGSVNLSCQGAGGIGCSLSPSVVTPPVDGSTDVTLTLSAPANQPVGTYNFNVEGTNGSDSRTAGISVDVIPAGSNGPQEAVYSGAFGAPVCSVAGSSCDSVSLVAGRANLGPEPNQPNTLDVCNDGTAGSYQSDESNERIVVSTLDGGNFTAGDTVEITATVFAWSTGSQDTLDLYFAADANSPSWQYITSVGPPAGGQQTLTAQYTLPTGALQAVRAQFRYQSTQTPCASGTYNDRDDLVFAVESGTTNTAPNVTISAPADGASFVQGASVGFSGTATDAEDGTLSSSISWSSSLDGSLGSGASISTTTLSVGTHVISATVNDSGGLSGNDTISIDITSPANTAPSVSINSPNDGASSNEGVSVTFAGTANDNEDGDISASLGWTSSLDGAIGSGGSFSTSTLSVGTHTITASVNDSGGLSGSDTIGYVVTVVSNDPPSVTISSPTDGSVFTVGQSVSLSGTATDPEDGSLSASISWSSSLDGNLGSGASISSTTLSAGTHTITATVTDSGSLSASDTVSITINTIGGSDTVVWMSFRTNTTVPGVGTVTDDDIVTYNESTGTWARVFDGSDVGLGGLEISGMALLPDGDILLSFTVAGTVGGIAVDDSDIVRFTPSQLGNTTAGSFSLYFDGSDVGLTTNGEDIDAITFSGGNLVISTLGSGNMSGLSGARDEDLLLFSGTTGSNTSGSFSLLFDGSDVGLSNSGGEDIDAASITVNGNLSFSTVGDFSVTGVSGSDEDIAEFSGSYGSSTSGAFSLRQDLSALGIATGEDIGSMHIVE